MSGMKGPMKKPNGKPTRKKSLPSVSGTADELSKVQQGREAQDLTEVQGPSHLRVTTDGGRGRYLMKGDYKPHPGAVAKAKFKLVNHA